MVQGRSGDSREQVGGTGSLQTVSACLSLRAMHRHGRTGIEPLILVATLTRGDHRLMLVLTACADRRPRRVHRPTFSVGPTPRSFPCPMLPELAWDTRWAPF